VKSRLPETSLPPRTALPAAQIALEAYWHVGRHLRIYAAQILVLSALGGFLRFVTFILCASLMAHGVGYMG
jgi:hypothetical protein